MQLDKRRKYYLILDCETATLPELKAIAETTEQRKKVGIAKPLIYDLGWQIIDRQGRVYKRASYLITEIFSVMSIFNTAHFRNKRPQYLEKLHNHKIKLVDWYTVTNELHEDLESVAAVGAYNSMFDFKKAIPFTEDYISALYSNHYETWLKKQCYGVQQMLNKSEKDEKELSDKGGVPFDRYNFHFRGCRYPLFDLWGLSCKYLLDNDEYRQKALKNQWFSDSVKYYRTSAECTFRHIMKENDFMESHTAFEDAEIESRIFSKIVKKKISNLEMGIIYFPFRIVGRVPKNITEKN